MSTGVSDSISFVSESFTFFNVSIVLRMSFILLVKLSNTANKSQMLTAFAVLSVHGCAAVVGLGIVVVFEGTVTVLVKLFTLVNTFTLSRLAYMPPSLDSWESLVGTSMLIVLLVLAVNASMVAPFFWRVRVP